MDAGEILEFEQLAIEDEGVRAEIAKLKLPEGTKILCDPWIYGMSAANKREETTTKQYRL